jgi:hypothetical protein
MTDNTGIWSTTGDVLIFYGCLHVTPLTLMPI